MKRTSRTGSRLFFIEFMIVLFFFLIVSTVCLRLFARAHVITRNADMLSHAQAAASSVAAAAEDAIAEGTTAPAEKTTAEGTTAPAQDPGVEETAIAGSRETVLPRIAEAFPDSKITEGKLVITYDQNFRPCGQADAEYTLTASSTLRQREETLDITVTDRKKKEVYRLSVTYHHPLTRREALL